MLADRPPLWQAVIHLPGGEVATEERLARVALTALGMRDAELEPEAPEYGIWLVGIPDSRTAGWLERENETIRIESPGGKFALEVPIP